MSVLRSSRNECSDSLPSDLGVMNEPMSSNSGICVEQNYIDN